MFIDGCREGYGELKTTSNMIYRGDFINDKPEGKCEIVFQNKDIWKG